MTKMNDLDREKNVKKLWNFSVKTIADMHFKHHEQVQIVHYIML